MTDGVRPGSPEPRSLDVALADLGRTLVSLRRALRRPGGRAGQEAASPTTSDGVGSVAGADVSTILEELLTIPAAGIEPQELFTLATDRVARLLGADRVMFFVADGERLRPRSARGFRRDDLESITVHAGDGIVGRSFREGRAIAAAAGTAADEDTFIERFPVREAIAVPVRAEDEVVGVLYAGRREQGRPFGGSDVPLLLIVADRMGGAFVHQRLLDRRGASIGRLAELAGFAGEAPLGRDLADVLGRACEIGCRMINVRGAAVAVGVEELELIAARGLPRGLEAWRPVARREGLTAELYAGAVPVACRDVQARRGAERSFLGDAGFHGCLLLPLRVRGLTLGVLYLADTEVRDFSVEEIELARVLAAMTASAVENSRVYAKLASALEGARSAHGQAVETEKARSLAEIAAGIAREFNQVFAAILGKSQLLLARASDDAVRDGLGVIEEAAWRGADVVRRISGLATPAADAAGEAVDMRALVQDAVALARTRWRDEGEGRERVEITADLDPVPAVRGDEGALRDAVGHLVRNALDAMPNGGRLILALRPRSEGVELVVEDTGEGFTDDVGRRMFDPFFTTRAPARMGLGLTLVRNTVTRCGGRVDVARGAGRGSVVTVWVPAAPTAEPPSGPAMAGTIEPAAAAAGSPAKTASAEGDRAARTPKSHASILVLEDEEAVRDMLVEALTGAGHEVHSAADGPAGLAKIEGACFDVVLADLALPQRSGLAIARSVKRVSPRTPVILITGWGHLLDPERLREHGVDLMLVKPFRPERVVSVVNDALRLHAPA